jgi:hypothetical protein
VYDVQGYPIGEVAWWDLVNATRAISDPGDTPWIATTGGDWYYTTGNMAIPSWTRVGLASVTGYALTDYPRFGGTPYGPQAPFTHFLIKAS